MAKIFLAFYNGIKKSNEKYAMPIFYESFIKGLRDSGNDVFAIMHTDWKANFKKIPENLLNEIKSYNPDLIFLFNNSFYDISNEFDCPIIIYEVDSPLYYRNTDAIKEKPARYKFFVAASTSIEILQDEYNIPKQNIIQVPFFTEVKASKTEFLYNISFIGTKFRCTKKNCYNKFIETNPDVNDREDFLNLISKLEENPFIKKEELLKNVESSKIPDTFDINEIIFLLSDYRRIEILSAIADLGLHIWGNSLWANDSYNNHKLILRYHPEQVFSLEDNQFIYNSSKIGINIGHLQAKNGFPWRVFDVMASNSCLVTEYHGDFAKYFPDLKLPYFSNTWEARKQCKKLLQDENYRLDIVRKSHEIVENNYRFNNILKIMENYLDIDLSSNIAKMQLSISSDSEAQISSLCRIAELKEWVNAENTDSAVHKKGKKLKEPKKIKDKIRYKIWKHYSKILKQKGMIQ